MTEGLVVGPIAGLLPIRDARETPRVLIASLAPGGAERIVLEWLEAEAERGREVELAVLHPRRTALAVARRIRLRVRGRESPEEFLGALGRDWRESPAPVSTHLITDAQLQVLWDAGVRTVPVVHNARAGWRNDPACWDPRHVPSAVACAEAVRREMIECGCRVPVTVLRHRPRLSHRATEPGARLRIREELNVGEGTFLVGAIGAIKAQKDHARALEVLSHVARHRDAVLVVLGGILERAALDELDRLLGAAVRLGMADRLRLPGFVTDIEPWLAACDALLNVSRFEGLSIAVQEALAAGLPVVAADVGGQSEIVHPGLELVDASAPAAEFARRLVLHPVRATLTSRPFARAPRAWSLTLAQRTRAAPAIDTLFVTANLNAGGAQRSLVNLAGAIAGRHQFAIAVCGQTTHAAFAGELDECRVETFRVGTVADDAAIAESLLAHAAARGARSLCFWNVAPGVKLLVARFAPPQLRIVDVSPGRYAFEELEEPKALAESIGFDAAAYYARIDALVLKHDEPRPPPARCIVRISNGVAMRAPGARSRTPRFLVSGRIAPSKRLETILGAFAEVEETHPEARLHVLGVAEPRHAEYFARLQAHASPGVLWRGAGFDLAHLDEAWTAAIVLGTHQGCPNAVLEAMAAAIPVIANASGGTGELVAHGETGWLLCEDAGAEALAGAMLAAAGDAEGARAMGRRARAIAAERFGLEAMARHYLALLAAETPGSRETIAPCNSASARAAPLLWPSVPSAEMPGS